MTWDNESARRFGVVLRSLRKQRKLSQEALAFQAGTTKNQVQLLEGGRVSGRKGDHRPSNPRMTTLAGLADVLDVPVSTMLADAGL